MPSRQFARNVWSTRSAIQLGDKIFWKVLWKQWILIQGLHWQSRKLTRRLLQFCEFTWLVYEISMLICQSVAGSHSTSGTLTLLFWHLLQNPDVLAAVQAEIESTLPPLAVNQIAYPIQGLELSLDYLMACVRENFRINPVFTMPLWRRVGRPDGLQIGEYHIPHNVSSFPLFSFNVLLR